MGRIPNSRDASPSGHDHAPGLYPFTNGRFTRPSNLPPHPNGTFRNHGTTLPTFAELDLIEPLRRALADEHYETPTPIQLAAIPPVLAGRDLLACAQTGTGKTAAFSLPVLQRLAAAAPAPGVRRIRCLVLSPTRELAAQIGERFTAYGKYLGLRNTVIFGGVGQQPQVDAIRRGVDILVATPGRLLDLIDQRFVTLDRVEAFVLDEADRMLDMGFIRDVRKILPLLPAQRQNLLFSATMPAPIVELAGGFLKNPARVEVTPPATTVERIDQSVMFVSKNEKKNLLVALLRRGNLERTIVFTRTKHGANKLAEFLTQSGYRAAAIHGNKSQSARVAALEGFRKGTIPVLVATDVASRGLDIDEVSHVINYDLPNEPESYVHRIGRTARAGRDGQAIAFCDEHESTFLRDIERTTRQAIPRVIDHPFHCQAAVPGDPGNLPPPPLGRQAAPRSGSGGQRSGGQRSGGQGGARRGGTSQTRW